jgi:hypothetical protein
MFFEAFRDELEKLGKNWIAGAVRNKGGLHRSLGVPAGKDIPDKEIEAAAKKPGKVGKQARLAETLKGLRKKKKKGKE